MKTYKTNNDKTVQVPTAGTNFKGGEFTISHKEWENYGKKRVYITAYFPDGGKVDCGFVDLTTGGANLKSSPVWIARVIEDEIVLN